MKSDDAPALEGWVLVSEAATRLNCTRQYIYRLISEGRFTSLHKIGSGPRPVMVLAEQEIEDLIIEAGLEQQ